MTNIDNYRNSVAETFSWGMMALSDTDSMGHINESDLIDAVENIKAASLEDVDYITNWVIDVMSGLLFMEGVPEACICNALRPMAEACNAVHNFS